MNGSKNKFMELAIALSEKSVAEGGGPFGAVVVRRGEVVATGTPSRCSTIPRRMPRFRPFAPPAPR